MHLPYAKLKPISQLITYLDPNIPSINAALSASCTGIKPDDNWCALDTAEVKHEFDDIVASSWGATSRQSDIVVTCSGSVKYRIALAGNDSNRIDLDNGASATLSIDDGWGKTYEGINGSRTHVLKSTLSGNPSRTGPFKGMGVLITTYQ